MRIGFVLIVLFGALMAFKVMESMPASASFSVIERKVLPMDVSFEKMQARTLLNSTREALNLSILSPNATLEDAAQAHADYLVQNRASSHYEESGKAHFTGKVPLARAFTAGYQASQVSENLSTHNDSAQNSMDGLFAAIYHRFGFLSSNIDEVGVGVTQDKAESQNSAFVYVMGNSEFNRVCSSEHFRGNGNYVTSVCKEKEHRIAEKTFNEVMQGNQVNNPKIIVYPYDGQKEVPLAFYNESPDPLPDYDVSGFPISIEFNAYYFNEVRLHNFKLFNQNREVVTVRMMDKESDPHRQFTNTQFALFPLERLNFDETYGVEIHYSDKRGSHTLTWQFHTKFAKEVLHVISEREVSIVIEAGKSHLLYFKPLHARDLVKNIKFPVTVDVQFIDNNTLKITLMDEGIDTFDIVSEERIVHIKVNS